MKIIETKSFTKLFDKFVGVKERKILQSALRESPDCGEVIVGTKGLRKLRWGRPGMGKRGGVRIIYYFYDEVKPLILLTAYAKNKKEDLTKDDYNKMYDLAQIIIEEVK